MQISESLLILILFACFVDTIEAKGFPIFILQGFGGKYLQNLAPSDLQLPLQQWGAGNDYL